MSISIKKTIDMKNSKAVATVELTIDNPDFDIISRSGPFTVDFGGTFTTTANGGGTEALPNNEQTIATQLFKVSANFSSRATGGDNEQVALDWFAHVETNITAAITTIRTNDAALTNPGVTYAAI